MFIFVSDPMFAPNGITGTDYAIFTQMIYFCWFCFDFQFYLIVFSWCLSSGFPLWLHFIPGIKFRTDNEPFKVFTNPCSRVVGAFFVNNWVFSSFSLYMYSLRRKCSDSRLRLWKLWSRISFMHLKEDQSFYHRLNFEIKLVNVCVWCSVQIMHVLFMGSVL